MLNVVADPKHDGAVAAVRAYFLRRDREDQHSMLSDIAKKELEEITERYSKRRAERMAEVEAVNKKEREKENEMGMSKKRRAEMEADAAKQAAAQGGEAEAKEGKLVKGSFGTAAEVRKATAKEVPPVFAKGNPRFKVFGLYGVCPLLRWMGLEGWTKDEARAVLVGLDANPTENALNLDMAAGAKAKDGMTKYGPVATVSAEHVAELNKLRGAVTSATAAVGEKVVDQEHLEFVHALAGVPPPPAKDEAPAGLVQAMTLPDDKEAKRIEKNNKARARRAAKKA